MSDDATKAQAAQPEPAAAAVADVADITNVTEESVAANGAQDAATENGEKTVETAKAQEAGDNKQKEDEASAQKAKNGEDQNTSDMLRTTRQSHSKNRAANSKYDASVLPESDDPAKIRAQVEFYFGDSNLPTDKFMWEKTGGPENKPVKLKTICAFGRMRRFKPYEAIATALRESSLLKIEGEAGEEEITRTEPYDPSKGKGRLDGSAVYVKGFGDEEPSTQFDLEAFFTKFGAINAVRLRRTPDKLFKGSVFVEFQDEETAKNFLDLDSKPQWKGHDLKIMSKQDYVEEKNELIRDGKIEPNSNPNSRFYEGKVFDGQRGLNRGRGGKGGDPDDWKKRRERDQKNGFNGGHRRGGGRGGRGRGYQGHRHNRDQERRRSSDNE